MHIRLPVRSLIPVLPAVVATAAIAAPTPPPVHVRGTILSVAGHTLTVSTPSGAVRVELAPSFKVLDVEPADRANIKPGSFVGITSVVGADGSQRAVEVHVFPASMRGAGEGTRPWDFPGTGHHSKMTNGTVSHIAAPAAPHSRMTNGTVSHMAAGSAVAVQYKSRDGSGSQTISIPPGIPVVTFAPGKPTDLVAGAHVFVMAAPGPHGALIAGAVAVGKSGITPPM